MLFKDNEKVGVLEGLSFSFQKADDNNIKVAIKLTYLDEVGHHQIIGIYKIPELRLLDLKGASEAILRSRKTIPDALGKYSISVSLTPE